MKRWAIFALFFGILSCGEENKEIAIPPEVLPKEKMAGVITDVHLTEAAASLRTWPDSVASNKGGFEKIYAQHQISRAQYDSSMSFYVDHPELLNEVYEIVLNELSKRQGDASKK